MKIWLILAALQISTLSAFAAERVVNYECRVARGPSADTINWLDATVVNASVHVDIDDLGFLSIGHAEIPLPKMGYVLKVDAVFIGATRFYMHSVSLLARAQKPLMAAFSFFNDPEDQEHMHWPSNAVVGRTPSPNDEQYYAGASCTVLSID